MNQRKISQAIINEWEPKVHNGSPSRHSYAQNKMKMDLKRYEMEIFPTYILSKSFNRVNAVGSATALVAILNKRELAIANIGDSGFILIRFKNGEPYCPHKSKE